MNAISDSGFIKNKNVKYCSELRNLPIVSIEEGQEIGVLNSFLVDPAKKRIVGFILSSHDTKSGGIKVVPFEAITSFGSFALTISRATSVSEVAANTYFIELFEKDIMLLGAEVRSGDDSLLGFVKDIGMDFTDGSLLSLKITSDAGFLSPYYAALPFSAVNALDGDKVIISDEYSVEFKKDTPFSEDNDKIYVPLVSQELQVKQLIAERLRSEIDRFRGELRERLFEQHEEYFLKRQKPVLEKALGDSLRGWLRQQITEAMSQSERDMTGHIAAAIEAFFESNHLRQLHEHINDNRTEIEQILQADASKRAELTSQAVELFNQRLAETESRIANNAATAIENLSGRVNALIAEHKTELESKTSKATADAADEIKEETNRLIEALETKFATLENTTEKASYDYRSALESLGSEVKSEWSAHKRDFETRATAAIDKISADVESLADRFESEKNSTESLYSELRAVITDAREHFHNELDARISELSHSQAAAFKRDLNTSLASSADRYNSQLSERIAALSSELRKNLDAISGNLTSELSNATDKIDSFSEELNAAAARNSSELDSLSAIARSAIHAAETAGKENAALASDFERISETFAQFTEDFTSLSRNTAEALHQLEDKVQSSESRIIDSANKSSSAFIVDAIENRISSLPAATDLEDLKASISDEIAALSQTIEISTSARIAESRADIEKLLVQKLSSYENENNSTQPLDEEIQSLRKTLNTEISSIREDLKDIHSAHNASAPAPAPVDTESILPLVEKLIEDRLSAAQQTSPQVDIAEAVSAEAEKMRQEIVASIQNSEPASAAAHPDTERILDTIEQWQQALDNRLTPIEDNWDTADQSLSDIQRAAEHQSDRLDSVDESLAVAHNSLDALNNILRGTENRIARLRDEVFSLGELLKSNAITSSSAQGQADQSESAPGDAPETDPSRITQLERKIVALEKTLSETRDSLKNIPEGAPASSAGDEQFDFLERNIAELAEKVHAIEKKTSAASIATAQTAPAVSSLELDSQKQMLKSLEQKVSSFELILPAVTDFFKDSGIRESVNIIRNAQEKSDKLLPAIEEKLSELESGLNTLESSIKEISAEPVSVSATSAPIEALDNTQKETSGETVSDSSAVTAALDEIKTQVSKFMEDISGRIADLSSSIETAENESREHATRLVESMQQQIDIALEDISNRIETGLSTAIEEEQAAAPEHGIDQSAIEALAEEQKQIRSELEALSRQRQDAALPQPSGEAPAGEPAAATELFQRAAEIEEKFQDLIDLGQKVKTLVTRDEAMQLQDEVVQDAIIQIDARFAGVATLSDIEKLSDAFRKQIKEKVDSMRDLVFDALEGKIEEVKSLLDTERIEHTIDNILHKKLDSDKGGGN